MHVWFILQTIKIVLEGLQHEDFRRRRFFWLLKRQGKCCGKWRTSTFMWANENTIIQEQNPTSEQNRRKYVHSFSRQGQCRLWKLCCTAGDVSSEAHSKPISKRRKVNPTLPAHTMTETAHKIMMQSAKAGSPLLLWRVRLFSSSALFASAASFSCGSWHAWCTYISQNIPPLAAFGAFPATPFPQGCSCGGERRAVRRFSHSNRVAIIWGSSSSRIFCRFRSCQSLPCCFQTQVGSVKLQQKWNARKSA